MLCEICNQYVWRKYQNYKVHKNCIVPLQVKAQLKGENSEIWKVIHLYKNQHKIVGKVKIEQKDYIIIDDLEYDPRQCHSFGFNEEERQAISIGYVNEEAWKDEPKQRRGEYFNNVKTIRR